MYIKIKSSKHFKEVLIKHGIPENNIEIISFGDSGSYLFYINTENKLIKYKISNIGISYANYEEINAILKLDILGKKEQNITPEQDTTEL